MLFGLFGKKKDAERKEAVVGRVVHYFPKVKAAVVKLDKDKLSIGDRIKIQSRTYGFEQDIKSMQIDHEAVNEVSAGQEAAIKVLKKARAGNKVLKIY